MNKHLPLYFDFDGLRVRLTPNNPDLIVAEGGFWDAPQFRRAVSAFSGARPVLAGRGELFCVDDIFIRPEYTTPFARYTFIGGDLRWSNEGFGPLHFERARFQVLRPFEMRGGVELGPQTDTLLYEQRGDGSALVTRSTRHQDGRRAAVPLEYFFSDATKRAGYDVKIRP